MHVKGKLPVINVHVAFNFLHLHQNCNDESCIPPKLEEEGTEQEAENETETPFGFVFSLCFLNVGYLFSFSAGLGCIHLRLATSSL